MTEPAPTPVRAWERVVADVRGEPGPTLLCVGAVHGNELAGLHAASAVGAELAAIGGLRGRFLALSGHLAAANSGDDSLRYFESDLNRMFLPEAISAAAAKPEPERTPDERELLAVAATLRDASAAGECALLDLHTVSSGSVPFVCVEDSLAARGLGLALGLPVVLGFEEELPGLLVDWATNELGVRSVVVEAGTHTDPDSVRTAEAAIWTMLAALGMLGREAEPAVRGHRERLRAAAGEQCGRVFDVRARVGMGEPPMELLERAQAFTRVWQGITPVARRRRGDGTFETVRSPADGLLFMPNRQKRRRAGDDAFFVLRPVWRRFMGMSEALRRRRWPQQLLSMLPGVSPDPGDAHTLHVDHDVAALMTRDVLHLFGYRIRRGAPIPYRRPHVRLLMALWVIPAAMLRAAGALPRGSDGIWVVRRHLLDVQGHPPGPPARR